MGQITPDTVFGKHVIALAENTAYSTYLDVGTHIGQGTTLCIASVLKNRPDAQLFSIEANKEFYERASSFYTPRPKNLHLIYGKLADSMMHVHEILQHPLFQNVLNHFAIHYTQDVIDFTLCPTVKDLPTMDVAIIDGGEFCGRADMQAILKLKPKVIALDDTRVMKNSENHEWLLSNPNWKLLAAGDERNGWSIFEKLSSL